MWLALVEVLPIHLEDVFATMADALPTENHLVDQIVPAVGEDALPECGGPLSVEGYIDILMNVVTPLQ